jgi:hypothetical protein
MYAADHGASVVQCALGTISMTDFAQRSLDYAYERNVLVITSMADENARHHNMPAAANHTLPVHAIQHDGTNLKSSSTFVAFHPCSNFGGQNLLSASGNGCSSEATGQLSGIAGLVVSAGKQFGVSPPLTPGELHSIFFTTADDIDVPESQLEGSSYRWSQPGFDQRFGYGRVNANRAVEAVKAGRIPPAVDVTSPHWFEVLYKDQVTGPVDIVGTVSAKRANSYDYVVEWAPGVQPLDDQFQVFHEVSNLPPSTVAGVDGPLASIDIRTIDPTHPRTSTAPTARTTSPSRCACARSPTTAARSATCRARCGAPTTSTKTPISCRASPCSSATAARAARRWPTSTATAPTSSCTPPRAASCTRGRWARAARASCPASPSRRPSSTAWPTPPPCPASPSTRPPATRPSTSSTRAKASPTRPRSPTSTATARSRSCCRPTPAPST